MERSPAARMWFKLRGYREAAFVAVRNRLAYRATFAGTLLTYGLFIFVFSRIWATVYADRAGIAGYSQAMCVWYFVIAELVAYGFGRFYGALDREIKDGQIACQVARPYRFTAFQYCQAMGPAILESGILFLEGALIAWLSTGPLPAPGLVPAGSTPLGQGMALPFLVEAGRAAALLLSLLMAGSLSFFLHLCIAMTAFWFEENAAFFWIFQKLTLIVGTLVPLEFLPDKARAIAAFTPFPALGYSPARIAVAYSPAEAARLLGIQALWLAAAIATASFIYARGLRRLTVNGG